MATWVPTRFFISAPHRPGRAALWLGVAVAALFFILAATNLGGFLPGMATSSRTGNEVTLHLKSGDRYFWLPSTPNHAITASAFAASLPGIQTITKRSDFQSYNRSAFDEAGRPSDQQNFAIEPNFLYEVSGVREDATFKYTATGAAVGTDFVSQIQANSNVFTRRLINQFESIPGTVWGDLLKVKDEVFNLFHANGTPAGPSGASGALHGYFDQLSQKWPILVGVIVFVLLGPFLGLGPLSVGLAGGAILMIAGEWILGTMAVVMGFLLDSDGHGPNAVQEAGLQGAWRVSLFASENPHAIRGILLYAGFGVTSLALSWFGHVDFAVVTVVLGGAIAAYVMWEGARDTESKRMSLSKLAVLPAALIGFLGAINGLWLFYLGVPGLGTLFLVATSLLAVMYGQRQFRAANREKQRYQEASGLVEKGDAKQPWMNRNGKKGFLVDQYWRHMQWGYKVALWVFILFLYLALVAATEGDWTTMAVHLLVGFVGLAGIVSFVTLKEVKGSLRSAEET